MTLPGSVDDVDAAWLTDAFRSAGTLGPAAAVHAVRAEQIAQDSGFSSLLYRLHLDGDAEVPDSVILKLPGHEGPAQAMHMLGGYARELAFYRDIAPRAPLGTPAVHAAQIDPETSAFVLVMEDLQGWHNADHLAGLTIEQGTLCIDRLAALHAWSIDPAQASLLAPFPSLDTPITRDLFPMAFGPSWQIYLEHARRPVPPRVAAFAESFAELSSTALTALTERRALLHGDIRADNMFFSTDGSHPALKVVDFQFAAIGTGVSDIAYLVSQGLPSEVRSGRDEDLLRTYLADLGRYGVTDYSFDDAWRHYRLGVAYYLFLPVLATATWETVPDRARQLCLTLVERSIAAIEEIDALELFG